ncbi:motility associated factor glycosyltransferase family protein [Butyrivibrio sp. AD3002]|uniref:motility associated factor glycosyltransferase family protein n=1 Tax=Butyrivibrio sp. AD3002 TaxID=1280670 RepID=UPI0003B42D40|nr:6-hydroxymethylpterin diphosphokinase MptE-like protein [Butyrivibrio sp. AD3002]
MAADKMQRTAIIKDEKIREKNFELYKQRYGEELTINPDEDKKYRMEEADDGEIVLYIRDAVPGQDLRLNSIYNPSYEAARWAEKQEILNRRTTLAILGFSTSVFIRALFKKLRPDSMFFVFEPLEDLFSFVCAFADLSDIIMEPRIKLYVTDNQRKNISNDMVHDLATFRPESKGIITPFYSENEAFTKVCAEMENVMASTACYQQDRGRNALRCRMYAWNHMRNAHILADLRDRIPKDIPLIIVSAGPSLRKNVEVLKKIKGHAFILATDRALIVLDEYDVTPDAIISLDAEKSPDFMNVKVARDIPVICSYQLNIDSQKLFYDRRIFYHALGYEYDLIGPKVEAQNGLDQGGNVSGGAFTVCEFLDIKTVILIGQDLAFLNGMHHADKRSDGTPTGKTREIPGIDGGTVVSNDMWIGFRDFFERRIAANPDMRVIDATEGGAFIEGTEIMTLAEVADTVCTKEYNLQKIFDDLPFAQDDKEYEETLKCEDQWLKDLDMIAKNSEEIEVLCRQLLRISKYQNIDDAAAAKKLNKMDKLRLEIYGTRINTLMEEFWIEDLYSIPDYTFMVRNNEEAIPVFESAMKFYGKYPEDCMSLKKELQEAIARGKEDFEKEKEAER